MNLTQLLLNDEIILDDHCVIKLEQFASLLHEWNQIHNLTGAKNVDSIYLSIVDSLYPITFIKPPQSLLDVGTGAGFPGLVLAMVWKNSDVVLCEPMSKRVSFLKYASIELDLQNVTVVKDRVQNLKTNNFELISSRAVTELALLLDITKNVSNNETSYLFYKGSRVFNELQALEHQRNYDIVQKNKRNYLWIHNDI